MRRVVELVDKESLLDLCKLLYIFLPIHLSKLYLALDGWIDGWVGGHIPYTM